MVSTTYPGIVLIWLDTYIVLSKTSICRFKKYLSLTFKIFGLKSCISCFWHILVGKVFDFFKFRRIWGRRFGGRRFGGLGVHWEDSVVAIYSHNYVDRRRQVAYFCAIWEPHSGRQNGKEKLLHKKLCAGFFITFKLFPSETTTSKTIPILGKCPLCLLLKLF